jgi:hypothetical protein
MVSCRPGQKTFLSDFLFRRVSPAGTKERNTMTIEATPQPLQRPFARAMWLDRREKNVIHQNMPLQTNPRYETHK